MSNSKNYNSIVFLTTLSVYLGLVLVGAPPILAHAAMTRHFDIQNEIEVKDDLDKKPDDLFQDIIDSGFIVSSISGLIEDLAKLNRIGKYEKSERFEIEFRFTRPEKSNQVNINRTELGGNKWSFLACEESAFLIEHLFSQIPSVEYFSFDKQLQKKVSHTKIRLFSENGDLEVKLTSKQHSDKDSQNLAHFLNALFKFGYSNQNISKSERLIYENTKALSENNQVFIVTRLPRGSLDALLARKDAQ